MLKITSLYSGSKGNSTLFETEHTAILIDAGGSCKALKEALCRVGRSLSEISAVFITHEHSDHISSLDTLSKQFAIPIHITEPSSRALTPRALERTLIHPASGFTETVGDITLTSFPLPHDSAAHVGYVLKDADGECAGLATDMGFASASAFRILSGCRQIVIEANHDRKMLIHGVYPMSLKQRILSRGGHLSNDECAEMCVGLADSGCEKIMLAHLSRENNTPELARKTVEGRLFENGFDGIVLKTAHPSEPVTL